MTRGSMPNDMLAIVLAKREEAEANVVIRNERRIWKCIAEGELVLISWPLQCLSLELEKTG